MNDEQEKLYVEFEAFERARGIKAIKRIRPHLVPFFRYLDERGLAVNEVRHADAQAFQTYLTTLVNEKGESHYATYSVKAIVSMVAGFYHALTATGHVCTNPFEHIKRIRTERKLPHNIPVEQVMDAVLVDLSTFWIHAEVRVRRRWYKAHVMAELMYATGMRISEVLALKACDIDFNEKTVKVKCGKGDRERIAYLTDYAALVLKLYIEEMRDVVNVNKDLDTVFGIVGMATVHAVFHRTLLEAGKKHGLGRFTSHGFRHTLGFHLLRRGCDMRYIQLILGHEDMNTTTIYTKVDKGDLRNELDLHHPRSLFKAS